MLRTLRLLRSAPRVGRAALEAHQSARLRRLVAHAYERVPFYRRLFDAHGLQPRHVRSVQDLRLIPITSRHELQAARPEDVVARGVDPSNLIVSLTSGSSGRPLQIRRTWLEQNVLYLYRLRAFARLGVRRTDRVMRISLALPTHARDSKLLGRALTALGLHRRQLNVPLHLPPEAIADEFLRYRPTVLHAYPSALLMLSGALGAQGRARFRPRMIVSGGEVLTPGHRARIEEELGAPVRNLYGSFEMVLVGWECLRSGVMHTSDDSGIVEVLADGRPAEPGESGEVVVTNLHAFASPFLRYRQGDLATRGLTPCTCGEPFATIREVQGRQMELLELPGGRRVHPLNLIRPAVVRGKRWMRTFQFTQERSDRLVLRVVASEDPHPDEVAEVQRAIEEVLGSGVEVEVMLVSDIPLEPGGKLRVVRSLVSSPGFPDLPALAAGKTGPP